MNDLYSILIIFIIITIIVICFCFYENKKTIEHFYVPSADKILDKIYNFFESLLGDNKPFTGQGSLSCDLLDSGEVVCREAGPIASSAAAERLLGKTIVLDWPTKGTEYIISSIRTGDKYTKNSDVISFINDVLVEGDNDDEDRLKTLDVGKYCNPGAKKIQLKKMNENLITEVSLKRKYKSFDTWLHQDAQSGIGKDYSFVKNGTIKKGTKTFNENSVEYKRIYKEYDNKDFDYIIKEQPVEQPGFIQNKLNDMNKKIFGNSFDNIRTVNPKSVLETYLNKYSKLSKDKKEILGIQLIEDNYKKKFIKLTDNEKKQMFYDIGVVNKDTEFSLKLTNVDDLYRLLSNSCKDISKWENQFDGTDLEDLFEEDTIIDKFNNTFSVDYEDNKKALSKAYQKFKNNHQQQTIKNVFLIEYFAILSKLHGTIFADYKTKLTLQGNKIKGISTDLYGKWQSFNLLKDISMKTKIQPWKTPRMKRILEPSIKDKESRDLSRCYYHHYPKYLPSEINFIHNTIPSKFMDHFDLTKDVDEFDILWATGATIVDTGKKSYECGYIGLSEENPETGSVFPDTSEWCGPATKTNVSGKWHINDSELGNHKEKRLKKDNEFAIHNRNIYKSKKDYRFGEYDTSSVDFDDFFCTHDRTPPKSQSFRMNSGKYRSYSKLHKLINKNTRTIPKQDYQEEDHERNFYPGLKYFYKPIYFYIPNLEKYDILMKNKLVERKNIDLSKDYIKDLVIYPKNKKEKLEQNIIAYNYSAFPSNYSITNDLTGGDRDNNVPNFPTAQFCYPYTRQTTKNYYQTSDEKHGVIDERVIGVTNTKKFQDAFRGCFNSSPNNQGGPITEKITYKLSVNIFRNGIIKEKKNKKGKKMMISVKEKINNVEIKGEELQVQIDKVYWNELDGISEDYDRKIACKFNDKTDGICKDIKKETCAPCDKKEQITLIDHYKKGDNILVISKTDFDKMYPLHNKSNNFVPELWHIENKSDNLIISYNNRNNKFLELVFEKQINTKDYSKGSKFNVVIKHNFPLLLCPPEFKNNKINTAIPYKNMKNKMNKINGKEVIQSDKDYKDYNTFYKCYNNYLDTIDDKEKNKIMDDINESDPIYRKLTDSILEKNEKNESCKYVGHNMKTREIREGTIIPSELVSELIGVSDLYKCINTNPCHKFPGRPPKCKYDKSTQILNKNDSKNKITINKWTPKSECCVKPSGHKNSIDKKTKSTTRYFKSNYENQLDGEFSANIQTHGVKEGKCIGSEENMKIYRKERDYYEKLITDTSENQKMVTNEITKTENKYKAIQNINKYLLQNKKQIDGNYKKTMDDIVLFYETKLINKNKNTLPNQNTLSALENAQKTKQDKTKVKNFKNLISSLPTFKNNNTIKDIKSQLMSLENRRKNLVIIKQKAQENAKKTFRYTDLNSESVYKKAGSMIPYESEKLKYHYNKCMDDIGDYLP